MQVTAVWLFRAYQLALTFTVVITAAIAIVGTRHRSEPRAAALACLMAAMAEWSLLYLLELALPGLTAKVLVAKLGYIGTVAAPVAWLVTAAAFAGQREWLSWRRIGWLCVVPLVTLLSVFTNDLYHLLWPTVGLATEGPLGFVDVTHGPAFWLHTAYSYTLLLVGTVLLAREYLRTVHPYRRQALALLVGGLAPWIGNVIFLMGWSPFEHLDLTPLAFAVTGVALAWSIANQGFFDVVPIAVNTVFANLSDPVIVLDASERVVVLNQAARALIGRADSELIGRPADELFAAYLDVAQRFVGTEESSETELELRTPSGVRVFDLRISPLLDGRGRPGGKLIALRDMTERQRAQEMLRESEARYRLLSATMEHQKRELELLHRVRSALARELDLGNVFLTTVDAIAEAFGYTQVCIYLLDGDALALQVQVGYEYVLERIPLARGISGRVARNGRAELVGNIQTDPDYVGAIEGVVSEVSAPLLDNGRVVGVLNVESTGGVRLSPADLQLVTTLAGYVGDAMERARLYTEARANAEALRQAHDELLRWAETLDQRVRQRTAELSSATTRLEALHQIDQAILAAQAPDETAQVALEHVRRMVGCALCIIVTIDSLPGEGRVLALSSDLPMPLLRQAAGPGPLRLWLCPEDLEVGEDIATARSSSPHIAILRNLGLRSYANIPLVCQGRILGVLGLSKEQAGPFSEDALAVAHEVADQIAVAVQQTRLRDAQQRYAAELEERVAERTATLSETAARLQAANVRLEELDQLKSQFVSNVSHELRTPLANIKLYLSLLEHGKPEKRDRYMATLTREAELLNQLIEDLLHLSRIDMGRSQPELAPVDLNALVTTLIGDRAALLAERGLSVTTQVDAALPPVSADAKMLTQVLTNLVTNAMHYTPAGGHITVTTQPIRDDGRVWVTAYVCDDGPGITPEDQDHIFERFYRGEAGRASHAPGTGLGLAICHEILQRHGGRITLHSEVGQGSTFTVWLPAGEG